MPLRPHWWSPILLSLWACSNSDDAGDSSTDPPADPIEEPKEEPTPEGSDWPELTDLDAELESIMEESRIPGLSACILSQAEVVWCGAYGWANIETEQAVTTTTPFMIASISKLFTATALMQLWEEELFELDDPVADVLDFPFAHPSDDTAITYRQLLSHVGGVRDNWDVMEAHYVDGDSPVALGDFVADYFDPSGAHYNESRNWVPDGVEKDMVYSNMGFALIGLLVEQLTGRDFSDYCQEEIFDPLQMEQTAWHLSDLDESLVAMPYIWSGGSHQPTGHYGYPDYPNGALRTSAESLARFMAMAMDGGELEGARILAEDTMVEMWTPQYPELDETQGLSWYSWRLQGEELWGHDGGDAGVATQAAIRWSDELGVVFLMNSGGTQWDTFESLEQALFSAGSEL